MRSSLPLVTQSYSTPCHMLERANGAKWLYTSISPACFTASADLSLLPCLNGCLFSVTTNVHNLCGRPSFGLQKASPTSMKVLWYPTLCVIYAARHGYLSPSTCLAAILAVVFILTLPTSRNLTA